MKSAKETFEPKWLVFGVVVLGLAARFFLVTFGHNYDLDSWTVAANIVREGGNVYAETTRYNYAPVWFNILYLLNQLAGQDQNILHYLITAFLSLVDVGIFCILWRTFGKLAASLFFLNPISIIITGFHCQFDNLALLLGLLSTKLMDGEFDQPVNRRKFIGLLVLGLSLTVKHILFAFPFWLAVKQKGFRQKCIVVLVPVAFFLLSFLPYWQDGKQGIISNVFLYHSFQNEYFYKYIVPMAVQFLCGSQTVWLLMLAVFAFVYRQKNAVESLLFYTAILVIASPAMTNQYLAIPVAFVSTYVNPFTLFYTFVSTWHLAIDFNGPHFFKHIHGKYDDISVCTLFLGLIWITWRQNLVAFIKKCREEIKIQFDP
jgi:hypothetical protein